MLRTFILTLLTLILCSYTTVDDVPNVHVADRTRYVSNPDHVLSDDAVANLNSQLASIWEQTTAEPIVVVIEEMDPSTNIDDFATELFDKWKIGKKDRDNGLLMVVSRTDRKAVIRTGRGIEGVITDVVAGRILRNIMFPRFKEGDFDGGVESAVDAIRLVLTDPAYAEELRSSQPNDSLAEEPPISGEAAFTFYIWVVVIGSIVLAIVNFITIRRSHRDNPVTRYNRLSPLKTMSLLAAIMSLGFGLIAYLPVWYTMRRIRRGPHTCPNCATKMKKIDEVHDNDYLTPAQDTEERLNSVDYDVWVCPKCNEIDILPFVKRGTQYTRCPHCNALACSKILDREIRRPTTRREGLGVKTFRCASCGRTHDVPYTIAKEPIVPVVIGGGGFGSGGGGGFSGGSFGGGMTSGGGASGGW